MATAGSAEEALEMYELYVAAEKAILSGQSYSIAGRALSRADLAKVRDGRDEWWAIYVQRNRGTGRRIKGVTPVC